MNPVPTSHWSAKGAWPRSELGLGLLLLGAGGAVLAGACLAPRAWAFAWLTSFMFFLSVSLGALFLLLWQHLVVADWMRSLRRLWEHLACLVAGLALLFLPGLLQGFLGDPQNAVYPWLGHGGEGGPLKRLLLTRPMFLLLSLAVWLVLLGLAFGLRRLSLAQEREADFSGQRQSQMARLSGLGMVLFGGVVTMAGGLWMMSVDTDFLPTMQGVHYFSGSVWVALATTYVLAVVLPRGGWLPAPGEETLRDLARLFFAFTLFFAYILYSQYLLVWNAAIPEETYWYVRRDAGGWKWLGFTLVFGHFLAPFLLLLHRRAKGSVKLMVPLCGWAWLMHYGDLFYIIRPQQGQGLVKWLWLDAAAGVFMAAALALVFLRMLKKHPAPAPEVSAGQLPNKPQPGTSPIA